MATAITSPVYDPVPTATNLADKYVAPRQQILTAQLAAATAAERGLTEMNSALLAFQTSLAALTGANKKVFAQSAVFGDTTVGSATASSKAAAGTYAFFVKQIATASQVSLTGLTDSTGVAGTLKLNMGGALAFDVDMAAANTDGGALSTRELAAAINGAAGNAGKVTASIVTTGGTAELVLTARDTGLNSAITLDTSGITGTSSLVDANADPARRRVLVEAQDAEIRVGAENGTAITQASNTFTAVDGVSMTFTRAQTSGAAPVTLTVSADTKTTTANVQAFVDAYNKLKTTLSKLTASGDAAKGVAGGTFAHDSGVRALADRLGSLLRPANGDSLAAYGIISTRSGTLERRAEYIGPDRHRRCARHLPENLEQRRRRPDQAAPRTDHHPAIAPERSPGFARRAARSRLPALPAPIHAAADDAVRDEQQRVPVRCPVQQRQITTAGFPSCPIKKPTAVTTQ
jgi:flagellar hook-associated protein 2